MHTFIPEEAQKFDLLSKDFQFTILNMLKQLKETMRTMSHQTESINKKNYEKELNKSQS